MNRPSHPLPPHLQGVFILLGTLAVIVALYFLHSPIQSGLELNNENPTLQKDDPALSLALPDDKSQTEAAAPSPEWSDATETLTYMMTCMGAGNCDASIGHLPTDEIEGHLLDALQVLTRNIQSGQVDFQQALTLAGFFFRQPLTDVKLAALQVFSHLPRTSQSLAVLLEGADQVDSAEVMQEVLYELSQYDSWSRPKIQEFLKSSLTHGSFASSPAIASRMSLFLDGENLKDFEKVLESLPPGSTTRKNLALSLESYRLSYGL